MIKAIVWNIIRDKLEEENVNLREFQSLFPICENCPGKTEDGYRTEKCEYVGGELKCVDQALKYSQNYKEKTILEDGDIVLNNSFGDLWVVDGEEYVRINDTQMRESIEEVVGFEKVGHITGVTTKKRIE